MSQLYSYLTSRRQKRVLQLLGEHSGRCKAVGHTLSRIIEAWLARKRDEVQINKEKIHTEEKAADMIEMELIHEVAKSEIPSEKMKEQLISFVRMLDGAAGSAKRAATNLFLLFDHPLPDKYSKLFSESSKVIAEMFELIDEAIINLENTDIVLLTARKLDELESKMDTIYSSLKGGYFEIEKSLNSAAALIILDHVTRDLEESTDRAEDAIEILAGLVKRRN